MSLLKDIINLGENLPRRDLPHFERFINTRKFDDALDLVNSVIILSEKAEENEINQDYLNLDKESILLLQTYLVKYIDQLDIEDYCSHDKLNYD